MKACASTASSISGGLRDLSYFLEDPGGLFVPFSQIAERQQKQILLTFDFHGDAPQFPFIKKGRSMAERRYGLHEMRPLCPVTERKL
jgi:hypothetical protein